MREACTGRGLGSILPNASVTLPQNPSPARNRLCHDKVTRRRRICNQCQTKTLPSIFPRKPKPPIMEQRRYTTTAWRQLGSAVHYCLPRGDKPLDDDEGEELHVTDPDLRVWQDDIRKQKLNAAIFLQQGVVEVTFFGPDQHLNEAFFQACAKVGIAPRFAIGRRNKTVATSILFKLRDDEAKRLDDEYSAFKPKAFSLADARRGVIVRYAPPVKKGSKAHHVTTLLPGSLIWAQDGNRL